MRRSCMRGRRRKQAGQRRRSVLTRCGRFFRCAFGFEQSLDARNEFLGLKRLANEFIGAHGDRFVRDAFIDDA